MPEGLHGIGSIGRARLAERTRKRQRRFSALALDHQVLVKSSWQPPVVEDLDRALLRHFSPYSVPVSLAGAGIVLVCSHRRWSKSMVQVDGPIC